MSDHRKLEKSLVRIYTPDRKVAGVGFLVGEKHILTCAHVVNLALDQELYSVEQPQGEVTLDFPFVAPEHKLKAKVALWKPLKQFSTTAFEGDIAGLEIIDSLPTGADAIGIVDQGDLWGRNFRAFGFPPDQLAGVWASGRTLAVQTSGWLQIEAVKDTGIFVKPGFSGTPIWDDDLGGVTGMIVAKYTGEEKGVAFAISVNKLLSVWPEITKQPSSPIRRVEERILEAAIASKVVVGIAADLVVMIRKLLSEGLRAILEQDDAYSVNKEDIRKKGITLHFPEKQNKLYPIELLIRVTAPDFEPAIQEKMLIVHPERDSEPLTFLLVPLCEGDLKIVVEVFKDNIAIGSKLLKTNGEITDRKILAGKNVAYLPIYVTAHSIKEGRLDGIGQTMMDEAQVSTTHGDFIGEIMLARSPEDVATVVSADVAEIPAYTNELQKALAWLMGVSAPPRPQKPEEAAEVAPAEELPVWLMEAGELPDWLMEEQPAEEEAEEATLADGLPDWLAPAALAGELPDWLSETEGAAEPHEEPVVQAEEPAQPEATFTASVPLDDLDTFAWLESLAAKQGASEALLLKPEDRIEVPPEWVQEAALHPEEETASPDIETEEPADDEEEKVTQSTPSPGQPGIPLNDEAAFAWLESLAVSQGANEALLLRPEDRIQTPPDWVLEAAQEGEEIVPGDSAAEADISWTEMIQETPGSIESSVAPEAEKPHTGGLSLVEQARMMAEEISSASMLGMEEEDEGELVNWVTKPDSPGGAAGQETQGKVPDLPSWLAGSVSVPGEELEWTPPPIAPRRYDLNKATLAELERLPGIGFIMAQQIITHRETNGPFTELDQLTQVPGFIESMLDPVREYLYTDYVAPTPSPEEAEPLSFSNALAAPPDLVQARDAVLAGDLDQAMRRYAEMIQENRLIDAIISDLQDASARYPNHVDLWLNLGDAYLRAEQPRQALEAYAKAEQLLCQLGDYPKQYIPLIS